MLDATVRSLLEGSIDEFLKVPKQFEANTSYILRKMGVETHLEPLISYTVGYLVGMINGFFVNNYQRGMINEEFIELSEVLKRRAWKIREALISTRIE